MTVRVRSLVTCLVVLFAGSSVVGQGVMLRGRVADPQGGTVGGAIVILAVPGEAAPRTTRTGADGTFSFGNVPAGTCSLRVEAPGFDTAAQQVAVSADTRSLDVVLPMTRVTENVVVAAPKLEEELPQELERSGVRLQVITGVEIENGGYYDVGQALQAHVPGLFLAPKAGAFDYVAASFQGSRTNEILWLVDGVRISNRLYNGTTPLDTLPAHMIERIEILEGGQGLFYGTQAVGGVINVVTKAFSENASGRVQSGFDTNKGGHISGFARDARRRHRFVLYGSKDEAEGFRSFPEGEYDPSTTDRRRSYDVLNAGGKYAYDLTPALRFSSMYQVSHVEVDSLRPARSSATQVGGHAAAFNERVEHILSTKIDFTPHERTQVFFKGYYHQWDSRWNEILNVASAPGTDSVVSDGEFWGFKDYGANVLARFAPGRGLEYFGGYDFQNYSGRDDVLLIAPNTERVHAVFGQIRSTPDLLRKTTLAAGVRFNAPTHSEAATVWTFSGQHDFNAQLFARGNVGTAFRYPDAYELFAIDPPCCFGNPDLKPDKSTNVNGSVGGRVIAGTTVITLEAVGFYRQVNDLIVDVDDGSGETTITANRPDTVRVRGASLVGSVAVTNSVSGSLGYTYSRSQRRNELAGGYSALAGIPGNYVEGSIDIHPARLPFGVTFTLNSVGEMFDTVSGFGSVPVGDYAVADLSGRVFLDGRRRHRINLRLENVFDEEYTTIHARGFRGTPATPFLVHNLGTPRTFHLAYSFSY